MPINYLQIQPQLSQYTRDARLHQKDQGEKLATALKLLHQFAVKQNEAKDKVRARLENLNPKPRCGIPTSEKVEKGFDLKLINPVCQVAASDGSQIIPDPHDEIPLGLINTSLVAYSSGNSNKPIVTIQSRFILNETGKIEFSNLNEDQINLKRDLDELEILNDIILENGLPAIAMSDGPLELFHQPQRGMEIAADFQLYKQYMRDILARGILLAGYTDKPRAGLIARMLSLWDESAPDLSGLADTAIFNQILQPGQRSAVFELFSPSSEKYDGKIKLFFFFLNVGSQQIPWTVRIEVPAVVASDSASLNLLHAAIIDQCKLMGKRPYPYILHRAHEEAIVSKHEKENLTQQIAILLRQEGIDLPGKSHKQDAKDLSSRRRIET